MTSKYTILQGNALHIPLASCVVQTCVTSPPYWALRDYGVDGQLGLEAVPDCLGWATGAPCGECYICHMTAVFAEVWRVLRDDGTCWVNMGDCYAGSGAGGGGNRKGNEHGQHDEMAVVGRPGVSVGSKPKDMMMIPARLALALQADGWTLRSDIIWAKNNGMPESVTDRPSKSHEHIFLLSKSQTYYYDADAVRVAMKYPDRVYNEDTSGHKTAKLDNRLASGLHDGRKQYGDPQKGANIRDVWHMNTAAYPEAHFATFPPALPDRCIKAGSREGDIVLDPFCGSGTTGMVARRLDRRFVGLELNRAYIDMAQRRIVRGEETPAQRELF